MPTAGLYSLIEYIPLQQGLRLVTPSTSTATLPLIEYIPLQQGLRQWEGAWAKWLIRSLSIFHYNKDQDRLQVRVQ